MISNAQKNQTSGATTSDLLAGSSAGVVPGQSGVHGAEPASSAGSRSVKSADSEGRETGENFSKHMESNETESASKSSSSPKDATAKQDAQAKSKTSSSSKSNEADSAGQTSKAKSNRSETRDDSNTVAHQVLKQLVKQNPGAKPPALRFLESQPQPTMTEELPQLMASSRFIADALTDRDLAGFLDEFAKPSQVMMELGFGPEMIVQAMAMGVDGSGTIQRGQILGAMGADPKNIETGLSQLKDSILAGGLTGYMQQSLAMANASGQSPDLVDGMTGDRFGGLFSETSSQSSDIWSNTFSGELRLAPQAELSPFAGSGSGSGLMAQNAMAQPTQPAQQVQPVQQMLVQSSNVQTQDFAFDADPLAAVMNHTLLTQPEPLLTTSLPQLSRALTAHAEEVVAIGSAASIGLDSIDSKADEGAPLRVDQFLAALNHEFGDEAKVVAVGAAAWAVSEDGIWADNEAADPMVATNHTGIASAQHSEVRAGAQNGLSRLAGGFDGRSGSGLMRDFDMGAANKSDDGLNGESSGSRNASLGAAFDTARDFALDVQDLRDVLNDQTQDSVREQSRESTLPNLSMLDLNPSESEIQPEVSSREKIEASGKHATELVRKIQDAVRHTSVSNIGAMRLDLSSEETGQLEIMVRLDSDRQVDVRLIAGSEELREMIVRELPQLRNALSEQNVNLRGFETKSAAEYASQMLAQGREPTGGSFTGQGGGQRGAQDGRSGIVGGIDGKGSSMSRVNQQIGRQALRSFRVLDLTDRSFAGNGRIKVLA